MSDLTPDRCEALQEMINIGFGRSIASLAELLHVHITLSVPDVQVVQARDLVDLFLDAFPGQEEMCLVQQTFRGQFFGEAVLVMPGGAGRHLMLMLGEEAGFQPDLDMGKLEMEALLEIGNVVMGACLGPFADLLQTTLSFNPPTLAVETASSHHYLGEMSAQTGEALLIKASFVVQQREVTGYLLVFLHQDCVQWLFQEVDAFLERAIRLDIMSSQAESPAAPLNSLPALGQLIDVLSQGLVVLDQDLRIVLWNRWMELHSRLQRDEVLGRVVTEVFPELIQKGFLWKVQSVFKLGNYAFFSQRLHRYLFPLSTAQYISGRYENMQQNAVLSPLRGEGGQVEYVCVSILDYTDTVTYQERLEETTRRLEQMAQTDHLTQVANRRHLFDRLAQEISRTCRQNEPLSVAIIDVDHFKNINDRFGHLCGDQALLQLASLLKNNLRPYGLVGRYGGEEFCLVLPETGPIDAAKLVDRLRGLVAQPQFLHKGQCMQITFSAGVSSTHCQPNADADLLLSQADEALYRAKGGGRNQTLIADASPCAGPQG